MQLNPNFKKLKENYLFRMIGEKTENFKVKNPNANIIRMGIGDVTLPLCDAVINAMNSAVDEMASEIHFKGYPPAPGYDFLREAIAKYYQSHDAKVSANEVYISDGSKGDVANILDIFSSENTVLIPDPVYPVYLDSNLMKGSKIKFINLTKENNFLPLPDINSEADLIYICSPNNPTGATYNHDQLKIWVDFANENGSLILFDSAYEGFVEDGFPHSIFEIEGAQTCAIEFGSFSKTAGMTGVRCAYTIIPSELEISGENIGKMWIRRISTKFNGVSYITQKGAAASLSGEGLIQAQNSVKYYKNNAKIICETLKDLDIWFSGGVNSPYVWFKCPNNMGSWEFFNYMLEKIHIVGTPGEGFGNNGKGYFRFSSFGKTEQIIEAMERLKQLIKDN